MDTLHTLLAELEHFGKTNDASAAGRERKMLNITPDTGEFLRVLILAMNAQRVLEIGTSNGYSTLWLGLAAAQTGGHVRTVELSEYKIKLAAPNFARSGLGQWITQLHDDAGHALAQCEAGEIDLLFLDSERKEYAGWWSDIKRVLRPGGLLVVDNATSHASEMQPFVDVVKADDDFATSLVPVGNGEFMAVKR
ncbi:MAG: class I SAM-dependent methyltransferase [Anaerolineae bacterium]